MPIYVPCALHVRPRVVRSACMLAARGPGLNTGCLPAAAGGFSPACCRLARIYNDVSVMENHHCAMTFAILSRKDCNMLAGLAPEQQRYLRKTIISAIMCTDMVNHFNLTQVRCAVCGRAASGLTVDWLTLRGSIKNRARKDPAVAAYPVSLLLRRPASAFAGSIAGAARSRAPRP
jgi:hypothetical protein